MLGRHRTANRAETLRAVAIPFGIATLGLGGALCAVAFWVALFGEIADFGAPADDPRPWLVAAYSIGLIFSLVAPMATDVVVYRHRWWRVLIAAALGVCLVLVTILGVD